MLITSPPYPNFSDYPEIVLDPLHGSGWVSLRVRIPSEMQLQTILLLLHFLARSYQQGQC